MPRVAIRKYAICVNWAQLSIKKKRSMVLKRCVYRHNIALEWQAWSLGWRSGDCQERCRPCLGTGGPHQCSRMDGVFRRWWIDPDHLRLRPTAGGSTPAAGVTLTGLLLDVGTAPGPDQSERRRRRESPSGDPPACRPRCGWRQRRHWPERSHPPLARPRKGFPAWHSPMDPA